MTLVDAFLILLPPVSALVAGLLLNLSMERYRRKRHEARETAWTYQVYS